MSQKDYYLKNRHLFFKKGVTKNFKPFLNHKLQDELDIVKFLLYKDKSFEKEVLVITDKKSNSLIPPDTDEKTGTPLCLLGEPMKWLGYNPDFKEHYYGCSLQNPSEFVCSGTCLKERIISYEEFPHSFNVIPAHCSLIKKFPKTRKLCESEFWRSKYSEGLHNMTLMVQHNVLFMSCITDICGIILDLKSFVINKKFKAA